ncbi:hypothetical protein XENORESO_020781 [Xenotaenia resolanae]|uniref:Uncharacterized protein n=1 Tax=Xenotaenia resolanae TaxID=208358 RepID=A0ABV0WCF1_9TELE
MRSGAESSEERRRGGGMLQDAHYYGCQTPVTTGKKNSFVLTEVDLEDLHHVRRSRRGVARNGCHHFVKIPRRP